ncbi:unnamed protein product [Caenorhabditis brenneri]
MSRMDCVQLEEKAVEELLKRGIRDVVPQFNPDSAIWETGVREFTLGVRLSDILPSIPSPRTIGQLSAGITMIGQCVAEASWALQNGEKTVERAANTMSSIRIHDPAPNATLFFKGSATQNELGLVQLGYTVSTYRQTDYKEVFHGAGSSSLPLISQPSSPASKRSRKAVDKEVTVAREPENPSVNSGLSEPTPSESATSKSATESDVPRPLGTSNPTGALTESHPPDAVTSTIPPPPPSQRATKKIRASECPWFLPSLHRRKTTPGGFSPKTSARPRRPILRSRSADDRPSKSVSFKNIGDDGKVVEWEEFVLVNLETTHPHLNKEFETYMGMIGVKAERVTYEAMPMKNPNRFMYYFRVVGKEAVLKMMTFVKKETWSEHVNCDFLSQGQPFFLKSYSTDQFVELLFLQARVAEKYAQNPILHPLIDDADIQLSDKNYIREAVEVRGSYRKIMAQLSTKGRWIWNEMIKPKINAPQ